MTRAIILILLLTPTLLKAEKTIKYKPGGVYGITNGKDAFHLFLPEKKLDSKAMKRFVCGFDRSSSPAEAIQLGGMIYAGFNSDPKRGVLTPKAFPKKKKLVGPATPFSQNADFGSYFVSLKVGFAVMGGEIEFVNLPKKLGDKFTVKLDLKNAQVRVKQTFSGKMIHEKDFDCPKD